MNYDAIRIPEYTMLSDDGALHALRDARVDSLRKLVRLSEERVARCAEAHVEEELREAFFGGGWGKLI